MLLVIYIYKISYGHHFGFSSSMGASLLEAILNVSPLVSQKIISEFYLNLPTHIIATTDIFLI